MSAIVLDGKALAKKSENDLAERVTRIKDLNDGRAPILATILVGDDPASATYVKMKQNACKRIGMESIAIEMPAAISTRELLTKIDELNTNPNCHGILLQHPVPSQIDERRCFDHIMIEKDVDGVTCHGFGAHGFQETLSIFGAAPTARRDREM